MKDLVPNLSSSAVTSDRAERHVRPARIADLTAIVAIHERAFARSFLTRLGPSFLELYYSTVLGYHNHIFLVSTQETSVLAFVSGFLEPAGFYKLMKRRSLQMGVAILRSLLTQPALIRPVLYGSVRVLRNATAPTHGCCELSSLAVNPQITGQGIGTSLVSAFLDCAWQKNASCVHLTTDASARANEFYLRLGFRLSSQERRSRVRLMNEYTMMRPGGPQMLDVELPTTG